MDTVAHCQQTHRRGQLLPYTMTLTYTMRLQLRAISSLRMQPIITRSKLGTSPPGSIWITSTQTANTWPCRTRHPLYSVCRTWTYRLAHSHLWCLEVLSPPPSASRLSDNLLELMLITLAMRMATISFHHRLSIIVMVMKSVKQKLKLCRKPQPQPPSAMAMAM